MSVIIFIVGCLVGYMICMTQWIKEIINESSMIDIEITKLKAKMEEEDGNNDNEV